MTAETHELQYEVSPTFALSRRAAKLLLVLVRIAGLAYLDLTTFSAFSETYLAPA